jgi:hypothetical protein
MIQILNIPKTTLRCQMKLLRSLEQASLILVVIAGEELAVGEGFEMS